MSNWSKATEAVIFPLPGHKIAALRKRTTGCNKILNEVPMEDALKFTHSIPL